MRRLLLVVLVACGGSSSGDGSSSTSTGGAGLIVQAAAGSSLTIPAPGGTVQLQALRHEGDSYGGPGTSTEVTASWSSSNPAVATVDANGLVKGISSGSAVITAVSGGATAQVTVTVGAAATANAVTIEWTQAAITTPVTTTVSAGTPVQWHAADATHNVIADGAPPPNTVTVSAGTTSAPQTITAKGTYRYHCNIHPGMRGTLIVQ